MSTTTMPQSTEPQSTTPSRGELGHLDLSRIAQDLQIRKVQVEAVVQLLDEENTIPFITRYRKERTGGLDEEVLRIIQDRVTQLRALGDRKQTILRSIEGQGKLTDDLRAAILAADNSKRLEDLYLPYKAKKRSLAQAARDKGLDKLAQAIWEADAIVANLDEVLPTLINPEQNLHSPEDVLAGAGHILAELIAETADVRAVVRMVMWDTGRLRTTKSEKLAEGQGMDYKDYFDFAEPIRQIPPHRILAINRGEKDNALTTKIEWDDATGRRVTLERLPLPRQTPEPEAPQEPAEGQGQRGHRGHPPFVSRLPDLQAHPHQAFLEYCADDGLSRLLVPSLEREIRKELTQRAEQHAVSVFARNLRSKLLAAPLHGKRVLAVDPAFRTGCKLAALDETGNLLTEGVIYPHAPKNDKAEAKARLEELIRKHQCSVIAIGNGTACRETEELISELIAELEERRNQPQPETPAEPVAEGATPAEPLPPVPADLGYVIVNEAGASVYSTSPVGREEFPNLDATLRGTISIGRRLQDPLSELVKIDPQHVGVGLYQHDLKIAHLRESLEAVIESCVNTVGIDLNTASVPLLRHVSGMNALTAQKVVEFRMASGLFRTREQLMQVDGIGPARFTQAAGFLKISGGDDPLDGTWIHPESYGVARQLLQELGFDPADLKDKAKIGELKEKFNALVPAEVAARLSVGVPTLVDILDALARPGRDPREDLPPPVFKKGILKLEDLQTGMELKGTVLNVVDFGAFIDIGLKDSGLVHISQMANRYVKSPYDVVSVGDVVSVWVLSVDGQRHRVSLTMIQPGTERRPPERRGGGGQQGDQASRPPRQPREGQAEGQGQGQPREGGGYRGRQGGGDRPPREPGARPPREGGRQGGGRGDRRQEGAGAGASKRSALPPRGTSRIGTGAKGGQQRKQDQPQGEGAAQGGEEQTQQGTPTQGKKRKGSQAPKLSQSALSGKSPLSSFSELAALMAAREKQDETPAPPPEPTPEAVQTETPPEQPPA